MQGNVNAGRTNVSFSPTFGDMNDSKYSGGKGM